VISNLAAGLACGEQEPRDVAAGLFDEVDRARSWVPKEKEKEKEEEGKVMAVDMRKGRKGNYPYAPQPQPQAKEDQQQSFNLFGFPNVPRSDPVSRRSTAFPGAMPAITNPSNAIWDHDANIKEKPTTDEHCAAHPMSRLKALEGVMDIALARIAELERKLGQKEMSQVVEHATRDVYHDGESSKGWGG